MIRVLQAVLPAFVVSLCPVTPAGRGYSVKVSEQINQIVVQDIKLTQVFTNSVLIADCAYPPLPL